MIGSETQFHMKYSSRKGTCQNDLKCMEIAFNQFKSLRDVSFTRFGVRCLNKVTNVVHALHFNNRLFGPEHSKKNCRYTFIR